MAGSGGVVGVKGQGWGREGRGKQTNQGRHTGPNGVGGRRIKNGRKKAW